MATFVELNDLGADVNIQVNTAAIIWLNEAPVPLDSGPSTYVHMSDGSVNRVDGTVAEVIALIQAAEAA